MGVVSTALLDRLAERKAETKRAAERVDFEKAGLDGLAEQVRRVRGDERDRLIKRSYEMVQDLLLDERGVELLGRCVSCGRIWEPGGTHERLSLPVKPDGSLCAQATTLQELGVDVPRPLLLDCPDCIEMWEAEGYACLFGFHDPEGCDCPERVGF